MLVALFAAVLTLQAQDPQEATPVPGVVTVAPAPAAEREDDMDRQVCRREHVVGSNRPQRVCRTRREWEAMRDTSRQQMDRATRGQPQELPRTGL
jgi:hypothetical protein